jgi:hypothetical protein
VAPVDDLCFEVGEASVEEPVVRAGGLEFLGEVAGLLRELADPARSPMTTIGLVAGSGRKTRTW